VSSAQNAEDVRLWRVLAERPGGFYVDVGAGDPVVDSVTRLFYEHGWSGVNIEPGPSYPALARARPRDINLNLAIGDEPGPRELWITRPDPALTSFAEPDPAAVPGMQAERQVVEVARLDDVLSAHARGRAIDFLKIDTEGAEREILASFDPRAIRPTVVVVEAISPSTREPTHDRWEHLLRDADYVPAAFDGVNRFYVPVEHEDLVPALAYPISALDRYESHGLVALRAVARDLQSTVSWRITRPLRLVRGLGGALFGRRSPGGRSSGGA
jgi:FkbM family methyltransferase